MKSPLDAIKIASPCHENWNKMSGDEQSRHCSQCQMFVYNLSEMTEGEAIALLESRGTKRTCIRMHRRSDGTMITKDCPVGVRKKVKRALVNGVAAAAVALVVVVVVVVVVSAAAPPPDVCGCQLLL